MYLAHIDELKRKINQLMDENNRLENEKATEIEKTRQMFNAQAEKERFELNKLRGQSLYPPRDQRFPEPVPPHQRSAVHRQRDPERPGARRHLPAPEEPARQGPEPERVGRRCSPDTGEHLRAGLPVRSGEQKDQARERLAARRDAHEQREAEAVPHGARALPKSSLGLSSSCPKETTTTRGTTSTTTTRRKASSKSSRRPTTRSER